MRTAEGQVKDKTTAVLKRHGCYYFMAVQMGLGKRTLDYLICHCSRFIAVEAKAATKDLTPMQSITRGEIERSGGLVLRVRDDHEIAVLDNILTALERYPNTVFL